MKFGLKIIKGYSSKDNRKQIEGCSFLWKLISKNNLGRERSVLNANLKT